MSKYDFVDWLRTRIAQQGVNGAVTRFIVQNCPDEIDIQHIACKVVELTGDYGDGGFDVNLMVDTSRLSHKEIPDYCVFEDYATQEMLVFREDELYNFVYELWDMWFFEDAEDDTVWTCLFGDPIGKIEGYIYLIKLGNYYKVGHTKDIKKRIAQLQTGNPKKLKLMGYAGSFYPRDLERDIHTHFTEKRVNGEWFKFDMCDVKEILSIFQQEDKTKFDKGSRYQL